MEALAKGFDNGPLFKGVNLLLEVGEKLAVLGTNGVGKSTLLKTWWVSWNRPAAA